MTAERVYAAPMTKEEAKNEIIKGRVEQFDPEIVSILKVNESL